MFTIGNTTVRNCGGMTRREMLQVGGLSLAGLTLADFFRSTSAAPGEQRRESACIFLWLDGGPSHLETFDPKPDTPDTIRGPYGAIQTNVPGIQICELLPQLSRHMDKCVLIRSMNHNIDAHAPVPMLTGFAGETTSYGAVIVTHPGLSRQHAAVCPRRLAARRRRRAARRAVLSRRDRRPDRQPRATAAVRPFRRRPRRPLPAAARAAGRRRSLSPDDARATKRSSGWINLSAGRRYADVDRSARRLRPAPRTGSAARTLRRQLLRPVVPAGPAAGRSGHALRQVKWYDGPAWDAWDVHGADLAAWSAWNSTSARGSIRACRRCSTICMNARCWNRRSSSSAASSAARRGSTATGLAITCRTASRYLLAGGGLQGGSVVGASDRTGRGPRACPVSPAEFAATLYRLVGIDTDRPAHAAVHREALPVSEIVG